MHVPVRPASDSPRKIDTMVELIPSCRSRRRRSGDMRPALPRRKLPYSLRLAPHGYWPVRATMNFREGARSCWKTDTVASPQRVPRRRAPQAIISLSSTLRSCSPVWSLPPGDASIGANPTEWNPSPINSSSVVRRSRLRGVTVTRAVTRIRIAQARSGPKFSRILPQLPRPFSFMGRSRS